MESAILVLAERGFHQTKIKDVAKKAGVADGTIYLYFKNKDDLLVQLFEEVMTKALSIFRKAIHQNDPPEEKLRCFLYTHLEMVKKEPELAQIISVVLRQSMVFMKEYKNPLFAEYLHTIRSILEEGCELGVFRKDLDFSIVERALFGAADELALAWLLSKTRKFDLEETSKVLVDMVLGGILPRTESQRLSGR